MNVLNNHILIAFWNTQTLTLKDSLATNTDNALVGANIERGLGRIIVRAVNPRPVITAILDWGLSSWWPAFAGSRTGTAAFPVGCSLGAGKVPGAVNEDGSGCVVRDPGFESVAGISKESKIIKDRLNALFQTGRCLSFCFSTTCSSLGKTGGCAGDLLSAYCMGWKCQQRPKSSLHFVLLMKIVDSWVVRKRDSRGILNSALFYMNLEQSKTTCFNFITNPVPWQPIPRFEFTESGPRTIVVWRYRVQVRAVLPVNGSGVIAPTGDEYWYW